MKLIKSIRKILIILTIGVLFVNTSFSKDRIIVDIEILSEESATIELDFIDKNQKEFIRITGWTLLEDDILKITYESGPNIPGGWNTRKIKANNFKFPIKIYLEEKNKDLTSFKDMPQNEELKASILNLYFRGIISGYEDGTFKPKNNVTRAEFSKLVTLTGKYKLNPNSNISFKDIKENFWAKPYIYTLAEKEILKGKGDGKFDPNGNITMGEALAVINRTFLLYNKEKSYGKNLNHHWSNEDFLKMVEVGIVKASDDFYKNYEPNKKATRQECALLLSRVLEQLGESK